jgi:hypothetical protein
MSKRDKVKGNGFADILGLLAETIAFFTIVLFLVLLINANWAFITNPGIMNVLNILKFYAPLALLLVVGLQVTSRQPFFIRIIFYSAIALIIVFQFFPGTWNNFIQLVK